MDGSNSFLQAMGISLERTLIAHRCETVASIIGVPWKKPTSEDEWQKLVSDTRKSMAKAQSAHAKREAKRDKEEAEMWLSIYQPGVAYDPAIHWVPRDECDEYD